MMVLKLTLMLTRRLLLTAVVAHERRLLLLAVECVTSCRSELTAH